MIRFKKEKKWTKKTVNEYAGPPDDFDEYITLLRAEKISGYSRDFLNLMIKENKLRAIKINQRWLTKKYWIDDCARKTDDWLSQSSEVNKGVEMILGDRTGFLRKATAVPERATDKNKNGSGRGDLYLWTSAMLFVLFFAVCFGQKSFGNAWFDVKSVSKQVLASPGAADQKNYKWHASGNTGPAENENVSAVSLMLAELYNAPVMPDENFTSFMVDGVESASKVFFMPEIGAYADWIKDSLKKKIGSF